MPAQFPPHQEFTIQQPNPVFLQPKYRPSKGMLDFGAYL